MKYVIILLTMFLTNVYAKAETCDTRTGEEQVLEQAEIKTDVPNHLKGAKIIVRLADGRESEVPAEKFKVVPRLQQYLVTKVSKSTVRSCITAADKERNRVSALVGFGPTGHLDRSSGNGTTATVEADRGFVGGVMYQRLLTDRLSIGIQGQGHDASRKDKTGLGVIGYDF